MPKIIIRTGSVGGTGTSWAYIAGLFDGEGCFSIFLRNKTHKYPNIGVKASISGDDEHLKIIGHFLYGEGIISCISKKSKINSQAYDLTLSSFDSVKVFINKITPFLILKKPQVELVLEAIKKKEELKLSHNKIYKNLRPFDELRRKLHEYSRKGLRILKPWY